MGKNVAYGEEDAEETVEIKATEEMEETRGAVSKSPKKKKQAETLTFLADATASLVAQNCLLKKGKQPW